MSLVKVAAYVDEKHIHIKLKSLQLFLGDRFFPGCGFLVKPDLEPVLRRELSHFFVLLVLEQLHTSPATEG